MPQIGQPRPSRLWPVVVTMIIATLAISGVVVVTAGLEAGRIVFVAAVALGSLVTALDGLVVHYRRRR